MSGTCEGREMRNAIAARPSIDVKATGERLKIERLTSRSEGGRWKRAKWHLAGGLPYRTPGLEGGVWKRAQDILGYTEGPRGESAPAKNEVTRHAPTLQ